MIRTVWVAFITVVVTFFLGLLVILASLLRVRGSIYYRATQEWGRAILWASGVRVITRGMERIDWSVPRLIVSNHVSFYDVFAIASVIPTSFAFVAKKELERIPIFGTAWKAAGHISIDRSNRASAIESLQRAGRSIREHRSTVIIYPEGTRSRTGELLPFKKGAFTLALEAQVPILPVSVRGSGEILPPGSWRIQPRDIYLEFGDPIAPTEYAGARLEALMSTVRGQMQRMLAEAAARESAEPGHASGRG